ncbi:MAG: DegV family protein [Actinomycetota bacterium]
MPRRVAVVADSACDLPPEVAATEGIALVPLTVAFGATSFLDGVELSPDAFWERVDRGDEHPTTASPSPRALIEAWAAAGGGGEAVVSVHLSSKLSRTVETARAAAPEADVPVEVVDSRSVSMGQGLVAMAAARAASLDAGPAEVAGAARDAATRLTVGAILETVEFLRRGGRVGRAKAAMSDLLRIRPILALEEGEPVLAGRARTRRRAVDDVLEGVAGPAEAAAVFHARAPDADEVARRVREATSVEPLVGPIGPVTGSHLGPGALGIAVIARP